MLGSVLYWLVQMNPFECAILLIVLLYVVMKRIFSLACLSQNNLLKRKGAANKDEMMSWTGDTFKGTWRHWRRWPESKHHKVFIKVKMLCAKTRDFRVENLRQFAVRASFPKIQIIAHRCIHFIDRNYLWPHPRYEIDMPLGCTFRWSAMTFHYGKLLEADSLNSLVAFYLSVTLVLVRCNKQGSRPT